ncbi:type II secretion system F family protein [Gluconobacter japonicus]|uniref:type II secretion system F family protein n=1 Tax=Gluconobacter japonicus TaxID=376620 RepID=UPI0024AE09C9|nr:type II secretion system F family protein [Gluconobacter japonicus]MDI6654121.1 type II secretion system F family protein [Gluconobacter japonicus]
MTCWRYRAIGDDGTVVTGMLDGESEARVVDILRRQRLTPLMVRPGRKSATGWGRLLPSRRRGLRGDVIAGFTRKLGTMLGAGLDLDRALRFVTGAGSNDRAGSVLIGIRDRVRGGARFADALEETGCFSRMYVGLVRAGEAGGSLPSALLELADLLERQKKLAATVQSAMVYPAILVVASGGSIVLLLTHVLPQFVSLFAENGVKMPTMTRFVMAIGDGLGRWGLPAGLIILLAALGVRRAMQRPQVRFAMDRWLLRVPILGSVVRNVVAARMTRTLGTLLGNGVPLLAALKISSEVVGNTAAVRAIDGAIASVKEGGRLAIALERGGVFSLETIQFLQVGEESAQLGPIALRAADLHEDATRQAIQRLLAVLVPGITIVMGFIVAGIVSSLLLAMLSLNDLVQ